MSDGLWQYHEDIPNNNMWIPSQSNSGQKYRKNIYWNTLIIYGIDFLLTWLASWVITNSTVFLPCFLHDISKKIFLTSHSIDWPNFVVWLSLLLEIPGIMCIQKESSRGVLRKRCSENIQQTYRRTSMSKCNFNKVVLHSPVNLLHIFRTPFPNSFSERRLLCIVLGHSEYGRQNSMFQE